MTFFNTVPAIALAILTSTQAQSLTLIDPIDVDHPRGVPTVQFDPDWWTTFVPPVHATDMFGGLEDEASQPLTIIPASQTLDLMRWGIRYPDGDYATITEDEDGYALHYDGENVSYWGHGYSMGMIAVQTGGQLTFF